MREKPCGCCEGIEKLTPLATVNRPGLDSLSYRAGTHASFLETMIARLSSSDYPELAKLTTRLKNDPSIALLDAWAIVADILTFYQERIANEGYLRTATERRSILELARLIGYKLRPGVAASVYLAFTLEAGYKLEIPKGTRAQSLPGPGELPQSFETSETLLARTEWNELKPRMTRPQYITKNNAKIINKLYFKGISTNLNPNDPLLFVFGDGLGQQVLRRVNKAEQQPAENRTKVSLQEEQEILKFETQVTAEDASEFRKIVEKYRNLEEFEVSPESIMAKSVLNSLQKLESALLEGVHITKATPIINETLAEMRPQYKRAVDLSYKNLEPWVGGIVAELEKLEARLGMVSRTDTIADLSAAQSFTEGDDALPAILISSLLKPPSIPPANSLRLERSVQTTFAPKTDMAPRILTTFKPKLKDNLYKAWANAKVTQSSALQSVDALRVKAAPFGHNAPLKPVYDDQGRVIGYEEWPLSDSVTVEFGVELVSTKSTLAELFQSASHLNTIDVVVSYSQDTDLLKSSLKLDQESTTVGDFTFKIDLEYGSYEEISKADFQFVDSTTGQTVKKFILQWNNTDRMSVGVNQDDRRPIAESQTLRYSVDGRRVSAKFSQNGRILSVSEQSFNPLPAAMRRQLSLDAEYKEIVPGSRIIIERPNASNHDLQRVISTIKKVETVSIAKYGITGKVTRLTLRDAWLGENDVLLSALREATVYAQSESLTLAEEPIETSIGYDPENSEKCKQIELNGLYDGLESGRWVIVSGERKIEGTSGVWESELAMIASITNDAQRVDQGTDSEYLPDDKIHSTIHLANNLAYTYKRDTVTLYGNVVKATHGETRTQVLGSGNAGKAFQKLTLNQSPLTYTAASTPSGVESTLETRVNDVSWEEQERLAGLEPTDRAYITQTDNDNITTLTFGNGQSGARLPTGIENVKAVYRAGIGKPGNVAAEQISLLATKPLSLKGVINPLRASGGADREGRDQARKNAPLAVMALDRLVSIQDYADFARTFAGIGKASSARLSDGRRQLVHITIAGADDIPIDKNSDLYQNLRKALHEFGEPHQPIQLEMRKLMLLVISADVRILPEYQWESVEPKIRAALLDTFSFDRRELGQDVLLSKVISTIQGVRGVAYVDVNIFDRVTENIKLEQLADILKRKCRIPVEKEVVDKEQTSFTIKPAQLACLSPDLPDTLILSEVMP